jgi:hypothetical protein
VSNWETFKQILPGENTGPADFVTTLYETVRGGALNVDGVYDTVLDALAG